MTNAIRIFSLREGLAASGTVERLETLRRKESRWEGDHGNILAAFELLLELRIRAQLQDPPSNLLEMKSLTEPELAALKKTLAQVEALRTRLSYDFLGRA